MGTTKNDIRNWLKEKDKSEVSHVLIVCDTFDHSDYPVQVPIGKHVDDIISQYHGSDMQKVMEVYNLNMDIEEQLNEHRAWNNQSAPKKLITLKDAIEQRTKKRADEMRDIPAYDKFGRPCRDLYFMNLAFEVAWKSIDPNTKHGCVAVDKRGGVITTGYNGPPQGCNDEKIPLTAPEKYRFLEHSERNVIEISGATGRALEGSTFYVTGLPCYECLRAIMGARVSRIIYGPLNSIMCMEEGYFDDYEIFLEGHPLVVERFRYDEELFARNNEAKKAVENKPPVNIVKEFNLGNFYGRETNR